MKRLLIYALCIGWAATTVGCSDDDERPVAFEVSQDTLLLDSDAGTVHVIVSAPGAWTITDIPEWVTVVPTEADGSREITIDYSENLDALREADLKGRATASSATSASDRRVRISPRRLRTYGSMPRAPRR